MQSRIEIFQEMTRQQPADAMIWYGLASEFVKLERWQEAADALRRVVTLNPDYTAAFQMLGTALTNLNQTEEARRVWTQGIEAATRTGAWKARQHMEGLLANSSEDVKQEFCQE
ncbi:MAG TPA: tetratricopeptide repeat protein [Pyrinomonadaceae bacterium]|jgi:predicted Zn-dependent protease